MTDIFDKELSQEAKYIIIKLNNEENILTKKGEIRRDKNLEFDFRDSKFLKKIFRGIYYKNFSIEKSERVQDGFMVVLKALKEYNPRKP